MPFTHGASHLPTDESNIVEFDGPDDLYRPINWSFRKKVLTTILYGMTTMGATWASSMYVVTLFHRSRSPSCHWKDGGKDKC